MVDQLDQQSIGVMEIEGTGAVTMSFGFGCQWNTEFAEPGCPFVDIVGPADDKTDMMDNLHGAGLLAGR